MYLVMSLAVVVFMYKGCSIVIGLELCLTTVKNFRWTLQKEFLKKGFVKVID